MAHKHGKTRQWAARQNRDPYVKQARQAGFRARAVFKLEQIDRKYGLLKPGSRVVDLGSAPGSWSQYAARRISADNRVIAVDLRAMKAIAKVNFIRGDFTTHAVVEQVVRALDDRPADLVLSDMAPNISGIRSADQARAEAQQHAVLTFCRRGLRPGGKLLTKLFAGEAAQTTRERLDDCFEQVRAVKPDASRSESKEIYLLARGYKGAGFDSQTGQLGELGGETGNARAPNGLYSVSGVSP